MNSKADSPNGEKRRKRKKGVRDSTPSVDTSQSPESR